MLDMRPYAGHHHKEGNPDGPPNPKRRNPHHPHTRHRGDQIVHCGQALIIGRHPTHAKDGTVRVDLQYPDGQDYGPGVFALNTSVNFVIGGAAG